MRYKSWRRINLLGGIDQFRDHFTRQKRFLQNSAISHQFSLSFPLQNTVSYLFCKCFIYTHFKKREKAWMYFYWRVNLELNKKCSIYPFGFASFTATAICQFRHSRNKVWPIYTKCLCKKRII